MMSSTHLSSRDAHQLVAMTLRPQSPGEASPAPHRQDPYARALRTALAVPPLPLIIPLS